MDLAEELSHLSRGCLCRRQPWHQCSHVDARSELGDTAVNPPARNKVQNQVAREHTWYDNRGNRTLKNLDGQRTTSTYDDANQLQWSQDASGRTTYTFDADGNQHVVLSPSGDRVTNLWDYENRLIGVLHPDGSRETMDYDPDGKRVMLQETASTTKYVWDDQNYLQETDASNVTQVTYTNEPRVYGNLVSQRKSSASHYYLFDALGSTRLVTDASQNISESLLYDAWGNLVGSAPTMAVPFRWVGELGYLFVPVTSDYYVRARVYQPGIGRCVSKDPVRKRRSTSQYTYTKSTGMSGRDPSGKQPDDEENFGWTINTNATRNSLRWHDNGFWTTECGLEHPEGITYMFSISPALPEDLAGYLIQKVTLLCVVLPCPRDRVYDESDYLTVSYFEAWPIGAGKASVGELNSQFVGDELVLWHDIMSIPAQSDTWGAARVTRELRYQFTALLIGLVCLAL